MNVVCRLGLLMAGYKLKKMDKFEKGFNKLPSDIKFRFEKQFRKLEENPYTIGKPLGQRWFRELKNRAYRVYYLIYDEMVIVLLVGVSNKKNQKKVIFFIKNSLRLFKDYVESKDYKQGGLLR